MAPPSDFWIADPVMSNDRGAICGDASFLNGTTANSELRILHGMVVDHISMLHFEWRHRGF